MPTGKAINRPKYRVPEDFATLRIRAADANAYVRRVYAQTRRDACDDRDYQGVRDDVYDRDDRFYSPIRKAIFL